MSRRFLELALVVALAACGRPADHGTPDQLFAGEAVVQLYLTLDDDAIAALAADPKEYVRGELRAGGRTWKDVGVRIKGNRSIQSWDGKPAFKLHFGKFDEDGRFFGLEKLALNNMVEDPTMLRETLAYELHRRAGVPAPRTAYAQVHVNRKPYGLYLMVEPADEMVEGLLYEGNYGCDLYTDDVAGFEQDGGKDETRDELLALAETAAGPADRLFAGDGPLDRARVLAYLAVSAYVGDFDGYRHGHNYRIHRDPETGRWSLLPWGLDRTFRKHLGIYDSGGLLAKRCFADAACRLDYVRTMHRVARLAEDLPAVLDRTEALIDDAVRADPRRPYGIKDVEKKREQLRAYLAKRPEKIAGEIGCLEGERELDRDGDGYGCLDVDDADPAEHPGAPEVCDGDDDDGNGLADDGPACACPEVVVDGVTFALCDLPMTWAEARDFCAAKGMTLARLDSEEQSRAVAAAAKAARKRKSKWWIGVTDRAVEDEFRWTDGTLAASGFTRWSRGEPDNDSCNQDCGALGDRGNGKWNDTHCASRLPFVCRKD